MVLSGALVFVVAYAVAAAWALSSGGPRRLWLTGAATLVFIAVATFLLGRHFAVPSPSRLFLVMMAFTAPGVVVPTVLLSVASSPRAGWAERLAMAGLGVCVGLLGGLVLVVRGLGAW